MADGLTDFSIFLISLVAGAAIVISVFISKLVTRVSISRVSNTDAQEKSKKPLFNISKKSHQSHINNFSNKQKHEGNHVTDAKLSFNCNRLLTSLNEPSSRILDMELDSNGEILEICAQEETDEPDPGGGDESGNSSGSEGNKENAIAPKVLLSRRQKKNLVRKEDSPGVLKKMARKSPKKSDGAYSKRWSSSLSSQQHLKMNIGDSELYVLLRNYLLTPDQVMSSGYPIESSLYPGRAIIYKSCSPAVTLDHIQTPRQPHLFDVNAREFVPSLDTIPIISRIKNYSDELDECNIENTRKRKDSIDYSSDEVHSSESVSSKSSDKSEEERSGDSDLGEDKDSDKDVTQTQEIIQRILKRYQPGRDEKKCVRCGKGFFVRVDGEYLTQEKCIYHWGKFHKVFSTNSCGDVSSKSEFSCCKGNRNSKGCSRAKLHVWNGVAEGVNGPLDDFVKTKPRAISPPDGNYGVYSLDCEMCYTNQGLELTKITIVAADGRTVYDSFVKPENTIIDYNTRFSGIRARDFKKRNVTKSLKDVQNDLLNFINSDTILIGHGLENDLKALKMIHSTVIDTSVTFPHYYGLPFRRSLRSLVKCYLRKDIQSRRHNSFEDARACMELMLWRVKRDFKTTFDLKNHALVDKF